MPTGAPSQSEVGVFKPSGGTLALAYGTHIAAGNLGHEEWEITSGQPDIHKLAILLGEGYDTGWDSVVRVQWVGDILSASPDATTPGYHFHRGTGSTGAGDPDQGEDSFFTDPLTFNFDAYVALRLTAAQSTQERTDGHFGVYKCLRVYDYNAQGKLADDATPIWSANPALIIADGFRRRDKLHRVHWPSLIGVVKAYCDEEITWNPGSGDTQIARFIANPVWTRSVGLTEFLDAVCLIAGIDWQDDGELIKFKLVSDQTPLHHFHVEPLRDGSGRVVAEPNIARDSFEVIPVELDKLTNWLIVNYRDIQDDWLRPAKLYVKREKLIQALAKENKQEIHLPPMTTSQAARIGGMMMRISTDNNQRASVTGFADSFHLLPGDYATVSVPESDWQDVLVRIEAITDVSPLTGPDKRKFTVRKIDGLVYSDDDHFPKVD